MELSQKDIARFWSKVDKSAGSDGCWVWKTRTDRDGYGRFCANDKTYGAHRIAYRLIVGEIPDELCVLHNCPDGDCSSCVNPSHLWLGTAAENNVDRKNKGRGGCGKGERHGTVTHPERVARGDRHGSHTHPENLPRGERASWSKLTDNKVREIRTRYAKGGVSQSFLAKELGVTQSIIGRVIQRKAWRHVN